MFVFFSLPNTILPFFGGKLTDTFGCRRILLIFSSIILMGQMCVNVGLASGKVNLALFGRFLFGIGAEGCGVAQAVLIAKCFEGDDKSLLLATSMNAMIGKLGSIANALISPILDWHFGIQVALVGATCACLLSFTCTAVLFNLTSDIPTPQVQRPTETTALLSDPSIPIETPELEDLEIALPSISATLSHLPRNFWVVCLTFVAFTVPYYCFNNTALDFLMSKWYTGDTVSAGFAMSIPMITLTMLLTICGSYLTPTASGFLVQFLSLILFTSVHLALGFAPLPSPTAPFILIGLVGAINFTLTYPFVNICIRREEARIQQEEGVSVKMLGLAFGVLVCVQNITLAIVPMCVARILTVPGMQRWGFVELFFAGIAGVGALGSGWNWWCERARNLK
ncbi:hypothetical protein HDU98_007795 [Podochytrium sp. JEL0797]|nr:hypothetical protein HDU98_007795 [Podochytrium sp. JEL0797]